METERTLQGTHIDAVGPSSLQISHYSKYEFLCHYLTVISKIFFPEFPQQFIRWSSIKLTAIQNHIYKRVLRQEHNQICLFHCRFFLPMPQLTPDCDRVNVVGWPLSDGKDFNLLHALRLFQMMLEIRMSEDYCRSDIYLVDYGILTLRHVTKFTPSAIKKYELCAIVSSTNIFCVNNESRS
jgi:hypothetical protein